MVVMFTTEGLTLATRAATSGVPGKSGGEAKGAGVAGIGVEATGTAATAATGAALGVPAAGRALAWRWQPAATASGTTRVARKNGREWRDREEIERMSSARTARDGTSFPTRPKSLWCS